MPTLGALGRIGVWLLVAAWFRTLDHDRWAPTAYYDGHAHTRASKQSAKVATPRERGGV